MSSINKYLSSLTYNGNEIRAFKQPNLFLGIGLWSHAHKLSIGLPIDVMHLLLPIKLMQLKIKSEEKTTPKLYILIADSMAEREGGAREEITLITSIYQRSLKKLLELLEMEDSEIILSSILEESPQYKRLLARINEDVSIKSTIQPSHYKYTVSQIAITILMQKEYEVGIKAGWLYEENQINLRSTIKAEALTLMDELKFDRWCEKYIETAEIDAPIQYLYGKAGLKQVELANGQIVTSEAPPYTAYANHRRYVVRTEPSKNPLFKPTDRVYKRWKLVAEVCHDLVNENLVNKKLLPNNWRIKRNVKEAVMMMLDHWTNLPHLHCQITEPSDIERSQV